MNWRNKAFVGGHSEEAAGEMTITLIQNVTIILDKENESNPIPRVGGAFIGLTHGG